MLTYQHFKNSLRFVMMYHDDSTMMNLFKLTAALQNICKRNRFGSSFTSISYERIYQSLCPIEFTTHAHTCTKFLNQTPTYMRYVIENPAVSPTKTTTIDGRTAVKLQYLFTASSNDGDEQCKTKQIQSKQRHQKPQK